MFHDNIDLGYLIIIKSAYIVHLEVKFTETFLTISRNFMKIIAILLRLYFSFVSISSFDRLDISLDIIRKLTLGSTVITEITRYLILHLVVIISVIGSFL